MSSLPERFLDVRRCRIPGPTPAIDDAPYLTCSSTRHLVERDAQPTTRHISGGPFNLALWPMLEFGAPVRQVDHEDRGLRAALLGATLLLVGLERIGSAFGVLFAIKREKPFHSRVVS